MYNAAKNSSCPYCPVVGLNIGATTPALPATVPLAREGGQARNDAPPNARTMPMKEARENSEEKLTQRYSASSGDTDQTVDPIVGWLVCVEGPDRGRDYRIKSERNFIGRSTKMDICISGDERISRDNHAIVAFDPRSADFRLFEGDARGLVYLNGSPVYVPTSLQPYDTIELGNSKLLFVPFCGERFQWPTK
jgi:hypothetical protein